MKLIIERDRWQRGSTGGELLSKTTGRMCCLGFYGLACGLTEDEIRGRGEPCYAPSDKWPKTCLRLDSDDWRVQTTWTNTAVDINDNPDSSDEVREDLLTDHFAKVGVDVEFR